MLVLSRKINETIVIDGRITVEIIQIQGDRIRIGIQAPADIKILRGELMPFATQTDLPRDLPRDLPPRVSAEIASPADGAAAALVEQVSESLAQPYRVRRRRKAAALEPNAA